MALTSGMRVFERYLAREIYASTLLVLSGFLALFALLVRRDGGYGLSVGNALPSASAAVLADRVATLNHMDEADLREHYLKLLANEGRTERGGAGLGLLTMVRKSGGNVKVYTLPRDERSSFLALELFIG